MGSAVAFLVLFVLLGCLCGPVPIVLGLVALGRIERSDGQLRGRGLAISAIILGLLALLALPVIVIAGFFVGTAPRSAVSVTSVPPPIMVPAPRSTITVTPSRGASVSVAPVAVPAPPVAADDSEEKASNAYAILQKKLSGELANDTETQIEELESYINEYGDTIAASRARVQLEKLKTPKPPEATDPAEKKP